MKTRVYLLKSLIFNGSLELNKFVGGGILINIKYNLVYLPEYKRKWFSSYSDWDVKIFILMRNGGYTVLCYFMPYRILNWCATYIVIVYSTSNSNDSHHTLSELIIGEKVPHFLELFLDWGTSPFWPDRHEVFTRYRRF